MNITCWENVVTVSTSTWFLAKPQIYDDFTQEVFKYAKKSYDLTSRVFNSTHWIWKGGTWQYFLNTSGHSVRFGISQDWSFQHFIDNNLPRYMLLEPFVRNQTISISEGPLAKYPDIYDICKAIGVRCTQKKSPVYFASIRPDRPYNSLGPIWHPEITRMTRKKILHGFSLQERSQCDKHIWLSRIQSHTNNGLRISNEKKLMNIYRIEFPDMLTFSNEPLSKIVNYLSRACVVAGVHGGLMYKTLFAPEDADIVEFASSKRFSSVFWVISEAARHRYHLALSRGTTADTHVAKQIFSTIGKGANSHLRNFKRGNVLNAEGKKQYLFRSFSV